MDKNFTLSFTQIFNSGPRPCLLLNDAKNIFLKLKANYKILCMCTFKVNIYLLSSLYMYREVFLEWKAVSRKGILRVLDGKGLYQQACQEEWKRCKKEEE
jgi:hypothetical protein